MKRFGILLLVALALVGCDDLAAALGLATSCFPDGGEDAAADAGSDAGDADASDAADDADAGDGGDAGDGASSPGCIPVPFSASPPTIVAGDVKTTTQTASVVTTASLPAGHTVRCVIAGDNLLSVSGESDVFRSVTLGGQGMKKRYEWQGASPSPGGSALDSRWTMTAAEDIPAGSTLVTQTHFGVVAAQNFVCQDFGVIGEGCALEIDGAFSQKTAALSPAPPAGSTIVLSPLSVTGSLPGEHWCESTRIAELAYDPLKLFHETPGWTELPGAGTNTPGQPTATNVQIRGEYRIVPDANSTTSQPSVTQNARRVETVLCFIQREPGEEVEEEALCGLGDVPLYTTSPIVSGVAPTIVHMQVDDMDVADFDGAPRMSELALSGMSFERFIAEIALCCPSRVTALLGQFAHNSGIWTNGGPNGGYSTFHNSGKEALTVATWLTATYRTAHVGKHINGFPNAQVGEAFIPPGWDDWVVPVDGAPYTQLNYALSVNGTKIEYGDAPEDYLNDVLTDYTIGIINSTPANVPLFLLLNPYLTHAPGYPPLRDRDCPAAGLDQGGNFNETDRSDKPPWIQALPPLTPQQIADMETQRKRRQRAMVSVERMAMKVQAALESAGRLHYFSVGSDNGLHQGAHGMPEGKGTAYEEDIRVPFWIRGPGIAPGSTSQLLAANVDYAPTWAEIAGVTPPPSVDGRSLLSILHGSTPATWRQAVLLDHKVANSGGGGGTSEPPDGDDAPAFLGLRLPDAKYIVTQGFEEYYKLGPNAAASLGALPVDPFELDNVHALLTEAESDQLSAWVTALSTASGASLRALEEAPPTP